MRTVEYACGCKVHVYSETSSTRFERCDKHKASTQSREEIEREQRSIKVKHLEVEK